MAFDVTILCYVFSFLVIMSQATIKNSRAQWNPVQAKFLLENPAEQANLGKKKWRRIQKRSRKAVAEKSTVASKRNFLLCSSRRNSSRFVLFEVFVLCMTMYYRRDGVVMRKPNAFLVQACQTV